jgi:hypothetical protein
MPSDASALQQPRPLCSAPDVGNPSRSALIPAIGVLPSSPLFHCRFRSSGLQEDFPCPFLVGAISAAHFLLTMKDVLHLLTHRENGEDPILANSVGSREFSYFQPLPRGIEYPPLFTLPARLRFTLMAVLAQFLLGPRSTDYYEPAPNSKNQFYPLRPMTLSPAVWEFFRARFASRPVCLRERVSSAFEQMAHAPLRQTSPERHRRFSFLRTQFSELSTTGLTYKKTRASPCFSYSSAARQLSSRSLSLIEFAYLPAEELRIARMTA